MPATFKGFGHRAAQEKPTDGGGQYHERKGYRQEVEGDERRDREAYEKVVVDGALGDPQDSLDDDGYHHWLDPVQKPRDHRHVGVGYSQVREEPQHEDGGDHEERAGHDPPYRPVQPPTDVGGHLLGLRARKEHAEVERPQVLALGNPPFPLDQLAVHDGNLARRSPEVDKTKLHPEPEGLPEPDRLDLHPLLRRLGLHSISIRPVNNILESNHGYIGSQGMKQFAPQNCGFRHRVSAIRIFLGVDLDWQVMSTIFVVPEPQRGLARQSSRTARSSWRRRAGSASMAISTIFPRATLRPNTTRGCPPGAHTAPTAPSTSAGRANRARPEKVSATARAPRTSPEALARTASGSARRTTSGSSTARSASKSPSREAARKASTTSRWRLRSASVAASAPRTRRRARLASIFAAFGERSTMRAISS